MKYELLTTDDGQQILCSSLPGVIQLSVDIDDNQIVSTEEFKSTHKKFERLAVKALTNTIIIDNIELTATLIPKETDELAET